MARFQGFDDDLAWELDDEGWPTETSRIQSQTQAVVGPMLEAGLKRPITLRRDEHITYLMSAFEGLSHGYAGLDSSKPWLCFWIVHALDLLGHDLSRRMVVRVAEYLSHCQAPSGGFCGGPQQQAHLAPTYAAVAALCIVGSGWECINRPKLLEWLLQLKQPNGGFAMHLDGEADVRATYCAMAVARLLQIDTLAVLNKVESYLQHCQSFEGGFGGSPGAEAHGGYTYCGAAAAGIIRVLGSLDTNGLLEWVARRQMAVEGGFSGRTNKLVDACYAFWQGAVPVITHEYLKGHSENGSEGSWGFDQVGLQRYLLLCCQNPRGWGGLIDKPGKSPDLYHTCYALSGLSLAQHNSNQMNPTILGHQSNLLRPTDPLHNVVVGKPEAMIAHFCQKRLD